MLFVDCRGEAGQDLCQAGPVNVAQCVHLSGLIAAAETAQHVGLVEDALVFPVDLVTGLGRRAEPEWQERRGKFGELETVDVRTLLITWPCPFGFNALEPTLATNKPELFK